MKELTLKLLVDKNITLYTIVDMLNKGTVSGEFNVCLTGDQELILVHNVKHVAPAKD